MERRHPKRYLNQKVCFGGGGGDRLLWSMSAMVVFLFSYVFLFSERKHNLLFLSSCDFGEKIFRPLVGTLVACFHRRAESF